MRNRQLDKIKKRYQGCNHRSLVIEEIRSGLLTAEQACQNYQLSYWQIRKWNRWYYRSRYIKYFQYCYFVKILKLSTSMKNQQQELEQLRKQLAESQAKVQQLELEKEVLNTVINQAEQEFKIEIRKKFGTRQSHK